ncbi:MAG: hypothetical protein ACXIUM_00365 [Wenzhouxiangella sp.]
MVIRTTLSAFNPAARAHWLALRNTLQMALAQPWLSALLALFFLLLVYLLFGTAWDLIEKYAQRLVDSFTDRAGLVWSALFVLSVASLVPVARRQQRLADTSWLAVLPQMPRAARRHSMHIAGLLSLVQSAGLIVLLILIHSHTDRVLPWFSIPLALVLPALAAAAAVWLAQRPAFEGRPRAATGNTARRAEQDNCSTARILRHWQWAAFRQKVWSAGSRWGIGALLLLIPAGVSSGGVVITLLVGWALIQVLNAWSAWLQVIVQASALLQALPTKALPMLSRLSVLPLMWIAAISLLIPLGLLALGAPIVGAVAVLLVLAAVFLLNLAGVLAWRHQGPARQWRIGGILVLWVVLSQSLPPLAPVFWLLLMLLLIKRAVTQ